MNFVGRIILLAAGVLLCIQGIPGLIDTIQKIGLIGWANVFSAPETITLFIVLCFSAFNLLVALSAIIGAFTGRVGFFTMLIALLDIAFLVVYFIFAAKNGYLTTWNGILSSILGVLAPVLYVIGTVITRNTKRLEEK